LRMIGWAGNVACIGEMRNAYTILIGRPEGKRPLGERTYRWEDNITMVKVKLFLCCNSAPCHERVLGSRGIAPSILDLGSRWR